ncbi:MAG: hypothetical protein HC777_02785 [Hyphomonadaceae bacterium]|nr:hypothetical protein [Hyphomonadaceae bacterium]
MRLDLSLDWRTDNVSGRSGWGLTLGLSRAETATKQARATYNSRLEETRLAYSYTPPARMGAIAHTFDVVRSAGSTNVTTTQGAFFNRFEAAASQGVSWFDGGQSQRLNTSIGTAIVVADGQWAWGRPVTDSFAIVSGHSSLGGRTIAFESRGPSAGATARTGLFGPAVISGLGTYSPRTVTVTVDDPPDGYDIGNGAFRIFPPLFGGYRFVLGSDMSLTVTGILSRPDGKPAALVSGTATSLDRPDAPPILIFTNAAGQFSLNGVGPGRWVLKMRGVADPFAFTLPPNSGNFVDLGTLQTVGAP